MADSGDSFTKIIGVLSVIAAFILAIVGMKGCIDEQQRGDDYRERIGALEEQVDSLQAANRDKDERLERSLDAFIRHYRSRIEDAEAAIRRYEAFDSVENRLEYGANFEAELEKRRGDARQSLQALIDLVARWKPVLTGFEKLMNGRVMAIDEALIGNRDREAFDGFGRLRNNVDSDIDLLKTALDDAADGD